MAARFEEYNQKRNFANTGEPVGRTEEPEERLRYVIQHHMARREHYDLRLEWNGALMSWAVPKGPSYNPRDKRLAVQVEDHPLEYRHFEGTIPKGEYGGGVIMLWDEGFWEPYGNVDEGLKNGSLKFDLYGKRLIGKWALVRLKAKAGEDKDNWLLLKDKDEYAKTDNGISEFDTSIRTGRTMEEIEAGTESKIIKNPFNFTDVQLAKQVKSVPESGNWLYELKFDGYRILAYLEGHNAKLVSRNGNDYTKRFHDVAYSLISWAAGRPMVLDGEMVVADVNGKTDFQALQSYLKNPGGKSLTYIIFDLLALDGEDLREKKLIERKEKLEALMKDAPKNLCYSQHVSGHGEEAFQAACQSKLEGIIGKKANSIYSGTRNGDWIKLKCDTRQEFVIGGYTLSDKKSSGISSLILGIYEGNDLIYAGRAGTGFTERTMKELESRFKALKRDTSPFKYPPEEKKNEKITWLEPELAAEIKFAEWTEENLLRQASFKGLRTDKNPRDIRREGADNPELPQEVMSKEPSSTETLEETMTITGEQLIVGGVKITSPDKVIFENPKTTKADVVQYYERVSERMLPYVAHRILSIVRCPKGVSQSCFYKKHPGPDSKGIVTIALKNSSGEEEEYFYIDNAAGLISEAQMGTLEFHPWGSRAEDPEKPDNMVFDLDPDEGMELDRVRQGVKDLKSILDDLSLTSFLKTSGGKGYHIVIPFNPSVSWDRFSEFARRVAEVMEQQWPDRYTSNIRKAKRKDKIFIDWIRNGRGATSIAPYSIRAKAGAKVSMPIAWNELDTIAPDGVDLTDALKRIEGNDPWKGFFEIDQRFK